MTPDPFALDDVALPAAGLRALPPEATERIAARVALGEAPLAAAAELCRRGDFRALRALAGAAAFVAPEDLAALALADGPAGTDALACVALASWLPPPARVAAVEALARAPLTAAGYAAVVEVADGPRKPPWSQASAALADMTPRAVGLREEMERLRSVARQVREGVRGTIHRQGFQRQVALGTLHPVAGMLVGDDGEFLAGTVPPIEDAAREPLMPYLVALLRASEERRAKALGFLQRRWREAAAPALSCVARTPLKAREAPAALAAVKALAAMGALDEIVAVVGAAGGAVRAAALAELARAAERGPLDGDRGLLAAALARATGDPDAAVRARAAALADAAR